MIQRRSEYRLTVAQQVKICWEERARTFTEVGTVQNVSLDGAGILMSDSLPVGTAVTISYACGELSGSVKHLSPVAGGQILGVEFQGPVRTELR